MEAPLLASQRRQELIARLHRDGQVHVSQLAREFGLTPETLRRDLDSLERSGIARRVHGGAVSAGRVSLTETALDEREVVNAEGKRRIAELACRHLLSS
ncbi:MAG TPA: DeoR family transcriptional regulator, partial [Candidatus Agrococcus pullicola]|nr:DeoR family transcriptional regulator [Candidatus Agrococcus pullicola]